jgi:NAD(P)-dependent dehydrogenase (short-subunit alcohol dehydrogenase family)
MMEIAGKTAFVTGAASGIGLGIATALSQAGVKVMLCDIEDAALVKAVADLKLTNADVDGRLAQGRASCRSRRHNRALWQSSYTGEQCGGWRWRILWPVD